MRSPPGKSWTVTSTACSQRARSRSLGSRADSRAPAPFGFRRSAAESFPECSHGSMSPSTAETSTRRRKRITKALGGRSASEQRRASSMQRMKFGMRADRNASSLRETYSARGLSDLGGRAHDQLVNEGSLALARPQDASHPLHMLPFAEATCHHDSHLGIRIGKEMSGAGPGRDGAASFLRAGGHPHERIPGSRRVQAPKVREGLSIELRPALVRMGLFGREVDAQLHEVERGQVGPREIRYGKLEDQRTEEVVDSRRRLSSPN